MLIYVDTSLFESPAQVLVNTVNTVGVMGKGIALQFKKLYPVMFKEYQHLCEVGALTIGKLWIYKTNNKWILNFPTKTDWRKKSQVQYIELGLRKFVDTYKERGIQSIAFPQLGVGNGGLDWDREVKPLMEKYLRKLPIDVYVHIHRQTNSIPEYSNIREMRRWLETEPQMLSVQEFERELAQSLRELKSTTEHIVKICNQVPGDDEDQSILPFLQIIHKNKRSYALSREEVTDFWMQLRDRGLVSEFEYPQILHDFNDVAFFENMMTQLPYISRISVFLSGQQVSALTLNKKNLPQQSVGGSRNDTQIVTEAR